MLALAEQQQVEFLSEQLVVIVKVEPEQRE